MPFEEKSASTAIDTVAPGGGATLEEVLDAYLEALAAGAAPDQSDYLRRYPELAVALRGVFRTLEFVEATSRAPNAARLEPGRRLGDFRLVRELGRGGMGVVYEAVQLSLDRRVALKVLPPGAELAGHSQERFAREAQTAGQLQHPHIVPVFAVGEAEGVAYYAMQFIEGESLAQWLARQRTLDHRPGQAEFRRVARWGAQAADALAYAHARGVLHRDIKPSNLLLDVRDNVWVTDFGLARCGLHATLTLTGDVVGTVRYMAPEQARGGHGAVDTRADVYALGATLYELLTLHPAFAGDSRGEVLARVLQEQPLPVHKRLPSTPRELEIIVHKCLEKAPARRYDTAAALAEDCQRFLENRPIRARATPRSLQAARRLLRRPVRLAAAFILAALLLVTGVAVVQVRRERAERHLTAALNCILSERDMSAAEGELAQAETWGAARADVALYRGLTHVLSGEPQRAIAPLEAALQSQPDSTETLLALAQAHYAMTDPAPAAAYLERVRGREINSALGWFLHGVIAMDTGASDPLESFNRAIALRSDFLPAFEARAHHYGMTLLTEGRREALAPMLDDLQAWVIVRPNSPRSYAARGVAWMMAGAYARTQPDLHAEADPWLANAQRDLETALAMRRADSWGIFARYGVFLRYVGDFDGSAEAFRLAEEINRAQAGASHAGILHQQALSLHGAGRLEEALAVIEPASAEMPSFFAPPLQKAVLLAELGRVEEARTVCRVAMAGQYENLDGALLTAAFAHFLQDSATAREGLAPFLTSSVAYASASEQTRLGPLLGYFAGQLDEEGLVAAAEGQPGRACEFWFAIALRRYGGGDHQGARAALEACRDTHVLIYMQYRFTQAFLARAAADAAWPAWISPQ